MRSTHRKRLLLSFFAFSFFHLALFCAYYLVSAWQTGAFSVYLIYFLADFVSYLLPTLAVAGMLSLSLTAPRTKHFLYGALLALSRIFYEMPTRAYGFSAEGFDTLHALLFSLLVSLTVSLLYFFVFLLLFCLASAVYKRRGGVGRDLVSCEAHPLSYAYAVERPLPLAVLCAVGPLFLYGFVRETVDTVTFLFEVSGICTTEEILYLLGRYLFLLVSLPLLQAIGVFYALKTAERTEP